MSGLCVLLKAHFLFLDWLVIKNGIRAFAKGDFSRGVLFRGVRRRLLLGAKEKILWVEKSKDKSLLGRSVFGLEEGERDLKRRNGFHLSSSLIFLIFLIFFMVVFPPSMS